jgi:cytochrome c-type biogenesis protein CcmF
VFPILSELVTGTKITVGPPYFKKVTGPLFFGLVLLMGVAPVFAWRKQVLGKLGKSLLLPFVGSLAATAVWGYIHRMHPMSIFGLWLVSFVSLATVMEYEKGVRARMVGKGENPLAALVKLFSRNHRRYGGYIIHLGVIMIALGIIGDAYFKQETQGTINMGQSLGVGGYSLRFDSLKTYPGTDGREVYDASASLYKDGKFIRQLNPRRDFFITQNQPVTVPGVYSTPGVDVYTLLLDWSDTGTSATFKIYINQLINWVWIGGLVMILGTLIAAWPSRKQGQETSYVLRPEAFQPVIGD